MKRSIDLRGQLSCAIFAMSAGMFISNGTAAQDSAEPPRPVVGEDGVPTVLFNFKGQSWDQILDYFSRVTGKPIVRDAAVPQGTVDYINPTRYSLPQAIETLNLLLQTQGVVLRSEGGRLILEKLEGIRSENIPTFIKDLPEEVTGDQIVTMIVPLYNATAASLAEQLKGMVATYGALNALPEQNSLLIIDTAANTRRIKQVIAELDREDLENVIKQIPLEYAEASALLPVLQSLMSERVVEMVQKGKTKVPVEKDKLPAGFRVTADTRTNSIIVRGTQNRVDRLQAALNLLDTPESGSGSGMQTITLEQFSPEEARARLEQLYIGLPKERKPSYVLLKDTNQITIVAEPSLIQQGIQFIAGLEGRKGQSVSDTGNGVILLPLTHVPVKSAMSVIEAVFTPRQKVVVKLVPSPDGENLIVAGPTSDIEMVRRTLETIDQQSEVSRQLRYVKINSPEPKTALDRAKRIHEIKTNGNALMVVEAEYDEADSQLVLKGTAGAIALFESALREAEASIEPAKVIRTYELKFVSPSEMAASLREITPRLLMPENGEVFVEPSFEPIDQLETLVVVAIPSQIEEIEKIARQLDVDTLVPEPPLRMIQLFASDVVQVSQLLSRRYDARPSEKRREQPVRIETDVATNTLLVTAPDVIFKEIEDFVSTLNRNSEDEADRATLIFPLKLAQASALANALNTLYPEPPMPRDSRNRPLPHLQKEREVFVSADPGTNTLIIEAPAERRASFEALVEQLDRVELPPQAELRTWTVNGGEGSAIVETLQQLADRGVLSTMSSDGSKSVEVTIEYEPTSRTLIVAGDAYTFAKVDELLKSLGEQTLRPVTSMRVFKMKQARADQVAEMLQDILAAQIRERVPGVDNDEDVERLLQLTSDRKTNTIIITAPDSMMPVAEEVIQALDSSAAAVTEETVKVRALVYADAAAVARSLQSAMPSMTSTRTGDPIDVDVVPSSGGNALVLIGMPADIAQVENLITPLDSMPEQSVTVLEVYSILGDATQVAGALQTALMGQPRTPGAPIPTVSAAPEASAIVVSATPEQQKVIASQIAKFTGSSGAIQVRTIFLEYSVADTVAPLLESMLVEEEAEQPSWSSWRSRRAMENQPQKKKMPVRVMADSRLNAVVVAGPIGVLQAAEKIIDELDRPARADAVRVIRVLPIRNAEASEVATSLEELFDASVGGERAPVIKVNTSSNTLLIRATATQFSEIESVASGIDAAAGLAGRQLRRVPIDPNRGNAAAIARMLEQMLDRPGDDRVKIVPLEDLLKESEAPSKEPARSNSEVPTKPAKKVSMGIGVQGLVATLIASTSIAAVDPVTSAEEYAATTSVQDDSATADPIEVDSAEITVAIDPETNSLIVLGSPRELDRFVDLADQTENDLPMEGSIVRTVQLPEGMNPDSVAKVVRQTLQMMVPAGGARSDMAKRCGIVPDQGSNALIVTCPRGDFDVISQIIATATRPAPRESLTIRVYRLKGIGVGRAAGGLTALLKQTRGRNYSDLAVSFEQDGKVVEAVFDPKAVSVIPDIESNSLVVMAPSKAMPFLDHFIAMAQDETGGNQATLKLFEIKHAKASELQKTLSSIFRVRYSNSRRNGSAVTTEPAFAVDARSNTLLATASSSELTEIENLVKKLDIETGGERYPLVVMELESARADSAARLLENAVLGNDAQLRTSTLILPDVASGVLLVRASESTRFEIQEVLARIDREATTRFPVRTITLERADAGQVAQAIERFYDDRARIFSSGRGRGGQSRRIAITGREGGGTLLVACGEADFEEIQDLVKEFDTADANREMEYRIYPLTMARADDAADLLRELIGELIFTEDMGRGNRSRNSSRVRTRGSISVKSDSRLNALVVTGQGDHFELVDDLVKALDSPTPKNEQREVRSYALRGGDFNAIRNIITEVLYSASEEYSWWNESQGDGTGGISIFEDAASDSILVVGNERQHEDVSKVIESLSSVIGEDSLAIEVINLEYADAASTAQAIDRFLQARTRYGGSTSRPVVTPVNSSDSMLVSGNSEGIEIVKGLVAKLDRPNLAGDRAIEIIRLKRGNAGEIARLAGEQFSRRGGEGVLITADPRTNSLLVNAPAGVYAQVQKLVEELDAPDDTDESVIRTYTLATARAEDAVRILSDTLRLDAAGRTDGISILLDDAPAGTPAVEVRASIVADQRSNSLVVTATEESLPVIESIIAKLEEAPARSPIEYKVITLENAPVSDVSWTLGTLLRARGPEWMDVGIEYNRGENQLVIGATSDQFKVIQEIISDLDVPSKNNRRTEFIALNFADASQLRTALDNFYGPFAPEADTPGKQNVRIIADENTNSLVITAPEDEWPGIEALLGQLDSEEYDSSLQLKVMPLIYADARGVAKAINEAFRPVSQGNRRNGRDRNGNDDDQGGREERGERRDSSSPILMQAEEWVSASAEVQTNALVVSANRQNMLKIERIISQLDVPEYTKLPAPRLISVTSGDPAALAESLRKMYATDENSRGGMAVRIIGDRNSNSIIVRAGEEEFDQILSLARSLQDNSSSNGLSVRVLTLKDAPAARVAEAIRGAFTAKAAQERVPFSLQVDDSGNSLVIASTGPFFEEISQVVLEMDRMAPAAGQGIFIIELENVPAVNAERAVRRLGLDKVQPAGSTGRLVVEPIKVSRLDGRNALLIVANPADKETLMGIMKTIDAEKTIGASEVRIVQLRNADADSVVEMIERLIDAADQQSTNPLARAVQEQIRRLNISAKGGEEPLVLDLGVPIRVLPDETGNAVVITSSLDNARSLVEVVRLFDRFPTSEAVTVQIFPLENMAAERFVTVVRDLFSQGREIAALPGIGLPAMPEGSVGPALIEDIALSIDERTNTVVVAGKESAVALVEVLKNRLDQEVGVGWVETTIIALKYADAEELAALVRSVVIDGATDLPGASPLQTQVARMRAMREGGRKSVESDFFVPLSRLVVEVDRQLNALVVVGSAENVALVRELVSMIDIEASAPSSLVRIYPIRNGSAERIGALITQLFQRQFQSKLIDQEDLLTAIPDARTNALVVSTSPRSFVVFEQLLEQLDSKVAADFREIKVLELKSANASRLAPMIQRLMDARLDRLRKVQPDTADLEKVVILADTRANALVVAAGAESFEVIARLASDLDTGSIGEAAEITVVPVPKGGLDRIAAAIDKIMERRYSELPNDIAKRQRPLVLTDPRTSSLMVAAAPEDLRAITQLVDQLAGTPSNPAILIEVLTLESASARELAPRIESLMRDRTRSLGQAGTEGDRVSVEADQASNSLIIAASEENYKVVRDLVQVLVDADRARIGDQVFEILSVKSNRASDLVGLIEELYVDVENRRRGNDSVRVSADGRLNAILASGTPEDIEAIRSLISRLDEQKPGSIVEVRYVPLTSANVLETVSLIENVLRGNAPRRGGKQVGTVLRYLQELDGEEMEVDVSSAIRDSISLTPDVRTNTIIVSAPGESMELIVKMITDLDSSSTGSKKIEVFKLVNADATATADLLTDLFQLRQQGNLYVLKPREEIGGGDLGAAGIAEGAAPTQGDGFGTDLTLVPDERQALSITVDSRTNSLIVSGTPTYLDLVSTVINDLDAVETNTRDTFVYQLRNAQADQIAEVVSQFVAEDQRKFVETLGNDQLPSAARLLEREVTIVGDAKSNSVLVNASPEYMEQVKAIIRDLDIDPPQVMIEVMLAEITLQNDDDYGLTVGGEVGQIPFAMDAEFSINNIFTGGTSTLGNFKLDAKDLQLVFSAMQSQGRFQLLSNPSITVANNEDARIQVGQTIRVPDSLATFDTGAQTSSVTSEEIGTILEVRPSINPDGFVRLQIKPELSRLEKEDLKISSTFSSPIIAKRTATTTVTVKDGETIVIGGLIEEFIEKTNKKVPLLGDIPVLGFLFSSESELIERREVLIVITPHVIQSPSDPTQRLRSQDAINQLPLPRPVRDEVLDGSLQGSDGMFNEDFESPKKEGWE